MGGVGSGMNLEFARQLRQNLTDAEHHLWRHLRHRQFDGCKFRRQAPIEKYIVDFVCFERKLIIELDGGQHTLQTSKDDERTRWPSSRGFRVLRFWNHEVFEDLDSVFEAIWNALKAPPALPRKGGGGSTASQRYTRLRRMPKKEPRNEPLA